MPQGYYYSIVFSPGAAKKAQFSYVFYSQNCSDATIQGKINDYAADNGFDTGRAEGPFADPDSAEADRVEAKQNFKDSGFNVGGDNNFFGDCSQ